MAEITEALKQQIRQDFQQSKLQMQKQALIKQGLSSGQAGIRSAAYSAQLKGLEPPKEEVSPSVISQRIENLQAGVPDIAPGTTAKIGEVNIPLNPKYTGEEVKALASAEELGIQLNTLKDIVNEDKAIWETRKQGIVGGLDALKQTGQGLGTLPFGGFSEKGQRFSTFRDSVAERLLRLRSGAQINENEYKRFMKMLPKVWRKDNVDMEMLDSFTREFNTIQQRIRGGALWDKNKKQFTNSNTREENSMDFSKMSDEELRKLAGQ